jgi:hypothetical protein
MTRFLPGITTLLVLLGILMFINVGQQMRAQDPTMDVKVFTNTTEFLWANASSKMQSVKPDANSTALEIRMANVIYKVVDTAGYVGIQVANTGVEYGFNNPDFQAKTASDALLFLIYAELAVVLFVPACALFYGVYLFGIWLAEALKIKIR